MKLSALGCTAATAWTPATAKPFVMLRNLARARVVVK